MPTPAASGESEKRAAIQVVSERWRCSLQRWNWSAPEGRLIIARRFNAGVCRLQDASPAETADNISTTPAVRFRRAYGTRLASAHRTRH